MGEFSKQAKKASSTLKLKWWIPSFKPENCIKKGLSSNEVSSGCFKERGYLVVWKQQFKKIGCKDKVLSGKLRFLSRLNFRNGQFVSILCFKLTQLRAKKKVFSFTLLFSGALKVFKDMTLPFTNF